jgi:hypothetical protein
MKKILLICALLIVPALHAQVPVTLNSYQRQQFSDVNGNPLAGGCVFTYQAGTSTPLATYTDSSGLFQNTNPLILDSSGEGVMWITSSAYKFVLFSSGGIGAPPNCASGSQQWTLDNVVAPPFLSGNNTWTGIQTFNAAAIFNGPVTLSAGGSLNGNFTGTPNFTGNPIFSGTPSFTGTPNFNNIPNSTMNPQLQSMVIANAAVTGTTLNSLAKLTGAPSTAVLPLVTDTVGSVGVVTAGAGTTGNATIQNVGIVSCNFDAATTAGDYVVFSPTIAGDCHDVPGGGYPSSGQVLGRTLTTNGALGLYTMDMFAAEDRSAMANVTFPSVAYSTASASTNANIVAVTMATVGASNATYRFGWYLQLSVIGSGCGGVTTVAVNIIFQDPLAVSANTYTFLANIATGNGVLGATGTTFFPQIEMRVKTATAIQYSTTYGIGSGCSPGPQYVIYPILEQLTAN